MNEVNPIELKQRFHNEAMVWDAHGCFPLTPKAELEGLQRYKNSGVNFLSINVGMDHTPWAEVMHIIAGFRNFIHAHPEDYVLIHSMDDILSAREKGQLAIAFDLEGSVPLDDNLHMIALYYSLGVKQMLLAYNKDNKAAGGCLGQDRGLTDYGRDVIKEMNRVGMIVDVSHMSYKSSMEAMKVSEKPVVFSHSNPFALWKHRRNIQDDQMITCAKTGGVIGINGIGHFLGENNTSTERFVEHIDYAVNLVGVEHVGLGLDYVVDEEEIRAHVKANPDVYPPEDNFDDCRFVQPEQFPEITEQLLQKGYSEENVKHILGENFLRVARQVWH